MVPGGAGRQFPPISAQVFERGYNPARDHRRQSRNSLWFTGSTIAQTLSGSAGLLGAIMLFALQETSKSSARAAVHDPKIRRSFWAALKASGVMIAVSIAACGMAPDLASHQLLGQIVLLIIVAGAVACLVLYGILLRALFRAPLQAGGRGT